MKKIKELMSDHPKVFVLVLLVLLLLVTIIIYRIADKYLNYSYVETESLYTFIGEVEYDFTADVTYNKNDEITVLSPSININFSSTPIYGKDKIIFPLEMIIIEVDKNYAQHRTLAYSQIKNDSFIMTNYNESLEHFFMYNTSDTYFFGDAGTLTVGTAEINLSKYSYVSCDDYTVIYYDYDTKTIGSFDRDDTVTFESTSYYINLANDTYGKEGNILPASFEYIDLIS